MGVKTTVEKAEPTARGHLCLTPGPLIGLKACTQWMNAILNALGQAQPRIVQEIQNGCPCPVPSMSWHLATDKRGLLAIDQGTNRKWPLTAFQQHPVDVHPLHPNPFQGQGFQQEGVSSILHHFLLFCPSLYCLKHVGQWSWQWSIPEGMEIERVLLEGAVEVKVSQGLRRGCPSFSFET